MNKIHLYVRARGSYPATTICGLYFATYVVTTRVPDEVTCLVCKKKMAK